MGRIARAFDFGAGRRSLENPAIDMARWVADWPMGGPSDTGIVVSSSSAARLATVYRCVKVISDGIAGLPLHLLERQQPRGSRKATENPLYDLLHLQPNPWHSSFTFRSLVQANIAFWGNGYAVIRRDGAGRIREIWPVPARLVEPKVQEDGSLVYIVRLSSGQPETWDSADMLHIPGLMFDGVKGISVLAAAREGIGIGLAAQKYGATLFRRGGRVPGLLKTTQPKMDPETRKNIREGWEQAVGGDANWHVPAILPKGWDYQDIGVKPEEAQWIETKKFQVLEICRFFGVNPHKVFDYERATFTNFEQSSLSHVIDTLTPWAVAWEQELNRKLIAEKDRRTLLAAFSLQGLMRGDTQARGQFYSLGRQWGWFSANDVRELEDLSDLGPKGDVYLTPFNMENSEQLAQVTRAVVRELGALAPYQHLPPGQRDARGLGPAPSWLEPREKELKAERRASGLKLRRKIRKAQRPIIEDRAEAIVRREVSAIERELKHNLATEGRARRGLDGLRSAIDEFYNSHAEWTAQKMRPILLSYAELINSAVEQELNQEPADQMPPELEKFAKDYIDHFGIREASEGRLQLLALIDEAEDQGDDAVKEAVQTRLDEWSQKRPEKIANEESVRFMGAAAKALYVLAGVTIFRWVSSPGACAFCSSLDGQVAGVHHFFVKAGDGVDGGAAAGAPLRPSDNIGHPPLHSACECDVVAD